MPTEIRELIITASDEKRDLQIKSPFQTDLLISRVVGGERLSQPFQFDLSLESAKADLKSDTILGQPVSVRFPVDSDTTPRYLHGIVTDFGHVGYDGRFHEYRATLRPWFWLLTRSADCRIFQDMSLEDIFRKVVQEHGFSDLKFRLQSPPPRRMHCVQYRETAFNFLSRLLEEEGIYYYFEHGESKHTMVLVNSSASHESTSGYDTVPYYPPTLNQSQRTRDHLTSWTLSRTVQSGGYVTSDFDFRKPTNSLKATESVARQYSRSKYEVYDFPADLQELSTSQSSRIAKIRLEELQTGHGIAHGEGTAVGLSTGAKFRLTDYPREEYNDEYLVIGTGYSLFSNPRDSGGGSSEFHVSVEAIPLKQQFRPPRVTPKPVVQGTQTAIVVAGTGKDKEGNDKGNGEIDADKFGRVRVKFHWDRSSTSSCLVRVAQVWAGKNWGAQYIPRIGHEVIVSFLEGDPDRPIIVGSVYNGDALPPYALPANVTQSGIKSRSSKDGGDKNFNEIRFEDKTGSEELVIHAEKDFKVDVENDATWTVGLDNDKPAKSKTGNAKFVVGKTVNVDAGDEITLVTGDSKINMKKDGTITIECKKFYVKTTDLIDLDSKQKVLVKAMDVIDLDSKNKVHAKGVAELGMEALQVKVEGTTQVGIKSSVMTKVEGTMLDLSANAIASLKGALTKIG